MDVNGTILGGIQVLEHAGDGFPDGSKSGGTEDAIATVVEVDALFLDVENKAKLDAPVQEWSSANEGIRQPAGFRLLLERILDRDLRLKDGERARLLV